MSNSGPCRPYANEMKIIGRLAQKEGDRPLVDSNAH